jgi:multiple sugar transport system substrate-binding protein
MRMVRRIIQGLLLAGLMIGVINCTQAPPQAENSGTVDPVVEEAIAVDPDSGEAIAATDQLTIWWTQGFLPEENEIIVKLVNEWKAASGYEANLVLLPDRDILGDTAQAIANQQAPDVLFSFAADTNLIPQLAWEGHLEDVSDLVEPMKGQVTPEAIDSVYYINKTTTQRSYYALPFGQNTVHLHYWRPLVEAAGFYEDEIPQTWDEFWQFWQTAHDRLRQTGNEGVYGIGFCLSALGTDTSWQFEQFLDAYDIEVVDKQGNLRVDEPEIRQGITQVVRQFAEFYKDGYIPPAATDWSDSGNNISFLEQESMMTVNSTLSVPFSQRQPNTPYNHQSTDYYYNQIRTIPWPLGPGGREHRSILSIKQLVILKGSAHLEAAKSFAQYFTQPDNIDQFLQLAAKGRIFPVFTALWDDPFWNAVDDPHLSVALTQHKQATRPSYQVYSPAYSQVLQENIWAKAILAVLEEGKSPEDATQAAIDNVKQIFGAYRL